MNYLSVCSGIEAATCAWHGLGWQPVGFSEVEAFPSAVLAHHYPHVKNYGDMTRCDEWEVERKVDLLVGGTPCQSFSSIGKRGGMTDLRGQLAIKFFDLVRKFRPSWVVWENVPGVLTSNKGKDFGLFLATMAECGYGFAYRILDAQHFGVAQRRRRVFVVGHIGGWRAPAAVLFERESLRVAARKVEKDKGEALDKADVICFEPGAASRLGGYCYDNLCGTIRSEMGDNRFAVVSRKPICIQDVRAVDKKQNGCGWNDSGKSYTLDTYCTQGVAFFPQMFDAYNNSVTGKVSKTIDTGQDYQHVPLLWDIMQVRRLTCIECERLQGFADNYTNIPWRKKDEAPDAARYKAIGNSMAVPVMRWIGNRLESVRLRDNNLS